MIKVRESRFNLLYIVDLLCFKEIKNKRLEKESIDDNDKVLVVMTIATLLVSLVFLPLRWINDEHSLVMTNLSIAISMSFVIVSISAGRLSLARNLFASIIGVMMVVVVFIHGPFQLNWVFSGMAMLYFTMRSVPALIYTQVIGLLIAVILFGDVHMERWLQDIASLNITMALLFFGARTKEKYNESLHRIALENEKAANIDKLTGMRNRRSFDNTMNKIFSSLKSNGGTMCILFIDIDHFKRINDTYGHDAGDDALVVMSKLISECVRSEDSYRIGGEEFVITLSGLDAESGIIRAEKIRSHMEENFEFDVCVDEYNIKERATVSIGVASYGKGDTIDSIIKKADSALYNAKHLGRNRVESFVEVFIGRN